MMMLTEDTAERMNVNDRLNARQSTLGGVRYLKLIKSRLPPSIEEPDRTWFALAAYNQGMAHLEDARVLAQRRGLNPNYWADVKRVLPLLADPAIHSSLKFGSARGGEAVFMVEKIRQYSEILMDLSAETAAEVD
jgi:membrane-bound lytic murein transglycosylase F